MTGRGDASPSAPPSLAAGRVHEAFGPSAPTFATLQAAAAEGPVIWVLPPERAVPELGVAEDGPIFRGARPDPYGLAPFLDPARVILVAARRPEEVYWAMEESLRSGAAPFVIAEAPARGALCAPDLTRSRRLQLAAESGGAVGLVLLPETIERKAGRLSNAAETRWRVAPLPTMHVNPSGAPSVPGAAPLGLWDWRLLKNKRGALGRWRAIWNGDAVRFETIEGGGSTAARNARCEEGRTSGRSLSPRGARTAARASRRGALAAGGVSHRDQEIWRLSGAAGRSRPRRERDRAGGDQA